MPHFSKGVRTWLNEKFNETCIGRAGSISWAPWSSDLTPLAFFLGGYIKTKVGKTKVTGSANLKERIEQEIKAIKKAILENVFDDMVKIFKFCIDLNGGTFEQYT